MNYDRFEVATVADLEREGMKVVTVAGQPIVVFASNGGFYAVEDRCPHMGFPLSKGTVKDGILTCHWHQARFDLCSGCSFDRFADDTPVFETSVDNGIVYVCSQPRRAPDAAYFSQGLVRGMEQNSGFTIARSLVMLRRLGIDWSTIIGQVAQFASSNGESFGTGSTILTIVANLQPRLTEQTMLFAMFRAVREIAGQTMNAAPRRPVGPLTAGDHSMALLKRWYRHWVQSRHGDAAERVLLTALHRQALETGADKVIVDLTAGAATDRIYDSGGHLLDNVNKMMELLDHVGWEQAEATYPLLTDAMASGRGAEEASHWHHPIDIVTPLRDVEARLPELLAAGAGKSWQQDDSLLPTLLGDDPLAILAALEDALIAGATPLQLAQGVCYAAALRLARFGLSNEVGDWFGPQHAFITANAMHRLLQRCTTPDVARGVFHSAITVYMDRFLNIPPAALPGEAGGLDHLSTDANELLSAMLDALDRKDRTELLAELVSRYVELGHPFDALVDRLTYATVREDVNFHYFQVLEAAVSQVADQPHAPQSAHILVGIARNLSAICPTARASLQLITVAGRLSKGERVHEG